MLSLKLDYEVPEDRYLMIQLPKEIKPGRHEVVVVVEEAVQILAEKPVDSHPPNPAQIFLDSGFIGCGEAAPELSENYKASLSLGLRDKYGDR